MTEPHALKRLIHQDGVIGFSQAYPCLGSPSLYAVYQVEEHLAHSCERVNRRGVGSATRNLPLAVFVLMIIVGMSLHDRFCRPGGIPLMARNLVFVVECEDNGLHLFPLARKPHAVIKRQWLAVYFLRRLTARCRFDRYRAQGILTCVSTLMEGPENVTLHFELVLRARLGISNRDLHTCRHKEQNNLVNHGVGSPDHF